VDLRRAFVPSRADLAVAWDAVWAARRRANA
jgi:hypothetical protein